MTRLFSAKDQRSRKFLRRFHIGVQLVSLQERNKPKQPPKAPKAAPFFLPTIPGLEPKFDIPQEDETSKVRIQARVGSWYHLCVGSSYFLWKIEACSIWAPRPSPAVVSRHFSISEGVRLFCTRVGRCDLLLGTCSLPQRGHLTYQFFRTNWTKQIWNSQKHMQLREFSLNFKIHTFLTECLLVCREKGSRRWRHCCHCRPLENCCQKRSVSVHSSVCRLWVLCVWNTWLNLQRTRGVGRGPTRQQQYISGFLQDRTSDFRIWSAQKKKKKRKQK